MPRELDEWIGANAASEKVAGGLGSVDGPVFSRLGYLLFCETAASRIMKWEAGKVSVFRENSSAAGLTFDHQGRLLACEGDCVTRTEKNGKITVLVDRKQAARDPIYAIDGSVYFSAIGPGVPAVYQITRHGEVRAVAHDFRLPVAVALAPNQQKLYAADAGVGKIWVYDIAGDGSLRGGRVFASATARGMKTDEGGNVWAAENHSLVVYDSAGNRRGDITLPEDPTHCSWGDGFRNLYVTAQTSIYRINTKANGTRTY